MIRDWLARLAFRLVGVRDMPQMAVVKYGPGDVLVLFHSGTLSEMAVDRIRADCQRLLGDTSRVMVLEEGMRFAVLARDGYTPRQSPPLPVAPIGGTGEA